MMIKVMVQEQKRRYTKDPTDDETTYWETTDEITSDRKEVVAGFLRALAESLDPHKPTYRSME